MTVDEVRRERKRLKRAKADLRDFYQKVLSEIANQKHRDGCRLASFTPLSECTCTADRDPYDLARAAFGLETE